MLRITVLSLLLGALALIAGLAIFFAPPGATSQHIPTVDLNATTTKVMVGTGTPSHGKLQLKLNKFGMGVVDLINTPIEARAYPFLHIALGESSQNPVVRLIWVTSDEMHSYVPENRLRQSLWLATNELKGWSGNISSLQLVISGQQGDTADINDFSISPASPARQLLSLYSDLTSYVPWHRGAMNSYTGVTTVSSFYPVPLTVTFLTLSLLGYGLLLLLFRARLTFNWHVVALIFLSCWIGLDMSWQNRLLHQLTDTYRTFSGKNSPEKLAVGPDAQLYNFVAQVKPLLEPKNARVFVHAREEYNRQRCAYYLYPFNVFWQEPGREFPRFDELHSGDYIVLIKPTKIHFKPGKHAMLFPNRRALGAEQVFSNATGTVLRLN